MTSLNVGGEVFFFPFFPFFPDCFPGSFPAFDVPVLPEAGVPAAADWGLAISSIMVEPNAGVVFSPLFLP